MEQPASRPVEDEQTDGRAGTVAEREQGPAERILAETLTADALEAVEPLRKSTWSTATSTRICGVS